MDYLKFILASKMGPGPLHGQPFGKVCESWQLEDYIGMLAFKYSLLLRGRSHDKTGGLARLARARLILSKEQEKSLVLPPLPVGGRTSSFSYALATPPGGAGGLLS